MEKRFSYEPPHEFSETETPTIALTRVVDMAFEVPHAARPVIDVADYSAYVKRFADETEIEWSAAIEGVAP